MILQIIAGGLAAVAVTAKLYWNRLLRFLRIKKDEPETPKADTAPQHRRRLARRLARLSYFSAACQHSHAPAGLEPGSFRDPESRVFYAGDDVFRALSPDGLSDFEALEATGLLDGERVVRTERADGIADAAGLLVHEPAAILRHERIPFVSYPYEWTFSMLKDAALLQLDLLLAALEHDMVLKDSTPYNVQFKGARPMFVDVGSFERLARASRGWATGSSACSTCIRCCSRRRRTCRFQPWLRGVDRRHHAPEMRDAHVVPRPLPQGRLHERVPARAARGPLRRPAAAGEGRGQARLQEGAVRRQRAQDAQARPAARLEPARGRVDGVRRAQQLHGRRRAPQGRVRPRGGEEPRAGTSSGTSARTTAATRASPPRARRP